MPKELHNALKAKDLPGYLSGPNHTYADGHCLYLRVRQHRGSWVYRYVGVDGKQHDYALGSFRPDTPSDPRHVTLADARVKAGAQRYQRQEHRDPVAQRKAAREAARTQAEAEVRRSAMPTFRRCYEEWERKHLKTTRGNYRENSHAEMARYVYPLIGNMPIDEVTRDHIKQVLRPIWSAIPVTAQRITGRLSRTMKYAINEGYRETELNPADREMLAMSFGDNGHEVTHNARVEPEGIPPFMRLLRRVEGVPARCAEAIVLSGMRSSNIRLAHWTQIDEDANVLTIPYHQPGIETGRSLKREVNKRQDFRVPLTPRLRVIIEGMKQYRNYSPYIFTSPRSGSGVIGHMALGYAVYPLVSTGITIHGFRSSFRDWAAAQVKADGTAMFEDVLCEIALAHKVGDATSEAYRRRDAIELRKPLMEMWDTYCTS